MDLLGWKSEAEKSEMAVLRGVAVEEDEEDEEDEESESEDEAEEAQMVQIPMLLKTIAEENEANECWCGVALAVDETVIHSAAPTSTFSVVSPSLLTHHLERQQNDSLADGSRWRSG